MSPIVQEQEVYNPNSTKTMKKQVDCIEYDRGQAVDTLTRTELTDQARNRRTRMVLGRHAILDAPRFFLVRHGQCGD